MLEEGGQLLQPLVDAVERQWRVRGRFGILEMEADTLIAGRSVRKATEGRYDGGPGHRIGQLQVEGIRPLSNIVRLVQAGQRLLPRRIGGVEVTAQAEPDL